MATRNINQEREFFRQAGYYLACQQELITKTGHMGRYDPATPFGKNIEDQIWMGLMDTTAEMYYILKAWREEQNETDNGTRID